MKLNQLCMEAHQASKNKGWYEGRQRHPLEFHMLMVSEIAEASEEVRNNHSAVWVPDFNGTPIHIEPSSAVLEQIDALDNSKGLPKPEGEAVELADVVIRIADYFGKNNWDLEGIIALKMAYNATRAHRHGGKAL